MTSHVEKKRDTLQDKLDEIVKQQEIERNLLLLEDPSRGPAFQRQNNMHDWQINEMMEMNSLDSESEVIESTTNVEFTTESFKPVDVRVQQDGSVSLITGIKRSKLTKIEDDDEEEDDIVSEDLLT